LAASWVVEQLPSFLARHLEGREEQTYPDDCDQALAALGDLSQELRWASARRPEVAGMGTTVVLALIRKEHARSFTWGITGRIFSTLDR
jgi:hypothetical protein